MTPKVSVIIPHYHDEACLKRLIQSLKKQVVTFPFEVLVISNPPSKKAEDFLRGKPNVIHLQSENVGVNKARNLGIRKSQGDLLLFLDSDCEVKAGDFLQRHYRLHDEFPDVSCVGGVYNYDGTDIRDLTYNYIQTRWLLQGQQGHGSKYLIGGNFSCKKKDLAGLEFDENIIYGGSETELFLRLRKENKVLKLFTDLFVNHNTHMDRQEFIKKAYKQGAGAFYLNKKHGNDLVVPEANSDLLNYEKSFYERQMDFSLALYTAAFNEGFSNRNPFTKWISIKIYTATLFSFYLTRGSDFFGSLENLLRNLPKK